MMTADMLLRSRDASVRIAIVSGSCEPRVHSHFFGRSNVGNGIMVKRLSDAFQRSVMITFRRATG